mgnify:CR=1 FL=1
MQKEKGRTAVRPLELVYSLIRDSLEGQKEVGLNGVRWLRWGAHSHAHDCVAGQPWNTDRIGAERTVHRKVRAKDRRWLVLDKDRQVVILRRVSRNLEPLLSRRRKGVRRPLAEDDAGVWAAR